MGNNGRLILVDSIIPPGNEQLPVKMTDIHMMVLVGAKERTREEFLKLLEMSGFKLANIIPTQPRSIIEGVPT